MQLPEVSVCCSLSEHLIKVQVLYMTNCCKQATQTGNVKILPGLTMNGSTSRCADAYELCYDSKITPAEAHAGKERSDGKEACSS